MHLIVQLIGVLIIGAGFVALFVPDLLRNTFREVLSGPWVAIASGARIVLGIAFWFIAPGTRGATFVRIIGVVMFVAGLMIPLVGKRRVEHMIHWFIARPNFVVRTFAPFFILLGVALVLAGHPL